MIRHVSSVAEVVEDVNAALKFYCDTLGLKVRKRYSDDYAVVEVPGILHFGVWSREHAAECTFGSREHAGRIPLGFTLEFEVDAVTEAAKKIEAAGHELSQGPCEESWGQKTFRLMSPAGGLLGFAETPWARRITRPMEVEEPS